MSDPAHSSATVPPLATSDARVDRPSALACLFLVALSIGVFVPLKYLYPSQMTAWGRAVNAGAAVWILASAALLLWPELPGHTLWAWLTLAYPIAYVALSFHLGGFAWNRTR
ncbi:MAG: hypothetical protein ACREI8_09355, partial [Myxococcota bacterium]